MSDCEETTTSACIRLLWSWDTGWPADTVEFCPITPYRHLMLCCTYKLADGQPADIAPEECRRDGQLHLLDAGRRRLLHTLPAAAVLDVKWSPQRAGGRVLAAAADARGQLLLLALEEGSEEPRLQQLTSAAVGGPGRLALALDWSADRLVVSDSSGAVTVLELSGTALTPVWTALCHGHEAWTCAFDQTDHNFIYTGGDDLLLRCYDVRGDPATAVLTNRSHEAGVTSVQSDPLSEHVLRSGSYDEHLYTWDTRSMRRPSQRAPLDGGVWRIKRHPDGTEHVLTACMYGGSHVTGASGAVVASFRDHASITYGADWCRLPAALECDPERETDVERVTGDDGEGVKEGRGPGGGETRDGESGYRHTGEVGVAVTCSFYDHLLCLWEM